uniref:Uncharacterized protein n=1 Tax=Parascaris equorum TaxID=6256 RepID=A0A914RA48_PAREQ
MKEEPFAVSFLIALIGQCGIQSSKEERQRRNVLVLASGLPPSWRVQAFYAEILRSLGCTAEALRIYEKQETWDNVIECYRSLGQLEKAEHVVRELIAKDDRNPLYYCMLGDIFLEPNYYEMAIEDPHKREEHGELLEWTLNFSFAILSTGQKICRLIAYVYCFLEIERKVCTCPSISWRADDDTPPL